MLFWIFWLFWAILAVLGYFFGHFLFWPIFAVLGMLGYFGLMVVSGHIFFFGLCWMLIWAIYAVFGYFGRFGLFWLFWPFKAVLAVLGCFGRFRLYLVFWAILAVFGYFTLVTHRCSTFVNLGPYFGCKGSLFLSQSVPMSLFHKDLGPYFYAHRSPKF